MDDLREPLIPVLAQRYEDEGARRFSKNRLMLGLCLAAFLVSGISQPLTMSAVKLAGLGDTTCQLYMVPYYTGMTWTIFFGWCVPYRARLSSLPLHRCIGIAVVDIISQMLNYTGNMLAGSAVFAVIYSSVTIWSAILSRLLLDKRLSKPQWIAILTVFSGLIITQLGANSEGSKVFQGGLMICAGSALHASAGVLSELVSVKGACIPPHVNCAVQGFTAAALLGSWQIVYTIPHWDLISESMEASETTSGEAILLGLGLAVGNFIHAATFFYLLSWVGAVSAGVLKGLQAVAVFCLAHILYCSRDQSQCFTPAKGASLLVVIVGVLGYAYATARRSLAR